jgi:hypothetical protein
MAMWRLICSFILIFQWQKTSACRINLVAKRIYMRILDTRLYRDEEISPTDSPTRCGNTNVKVSLMGEGLSHNFLLREIVWKFWQTLIAFDLAKYFLGGRISRKQYSFPSASLNVKNVKGTQVLDCVTLILLKMSYVFHTQEKFINFLW